MGGGPVGARDAERLAWLWGAIKFLLELVVCCFTPACVCALVFLSFCPSLPHPLY